MLKHPRKKQNNTMLIVIVVAVLCIGGLIALVKGNAKTESSVTDVAAVDKLAQCITEK